MSRKNYRPNVMLYGGPPPPEAPNPPGVGVWPWAPVEIKPPAPAEPSPPPAYFETMSRKEIAEQFASLRASINELEASISALIDVMAQKSKDSLDMRRDASHDKGVTLPLIRLELSASPSMARPFYRASVGEEKGEWWPSVEGAIRSVCARSGAVYEIANLAGVALVLQGELPEGIVLCECGRAPYTPAVKETECELCRAAHRSR